MAVRGKIQNFTKAGASMPGFANTRVNTGAVAGTLLADGRIIPFPRPVLDSGLKAGGRVRVLNEAALSSRQTRLHGGLGMGVGPSRS